jgi:colicin import membrane protein
MTMGGMAAARAGVFRPKAEDTLGLGAILALAAHLLLVLALAFGVSWRTHKTEVAEAEVWSEVPTAAAPAAEPPPPSPPTPVEEAPPPPSPVQQAEPEPEPEPIAEIQKKPEPKAKPKKEKPVAKAEPKPKEKPKKEKPPKETFINDKPVVAKTPPKAVPTPPAPPTVSSAEREAQRKAAMQRMMKDLGSLGTSEHAAGPSASYVGKLRARIIPNITFLMDEGNGNPTAFVEIRCAPDGTILSRRLLDPSGSPAWDKAVLDGIDKTRSLPFDEKGRLPDTVFQIGISPRDR